MPVEKLFSCSTSNITEADSEVLRLRSAPDSSTGPLLVVYEKGKYGYLIWVPNSDMVEDTGDEGLPALCRGLSPSFVKCLSLASKLGCEWLMLDCDEEAEQGLGLDVHDW